MSDGPYDPAWVSKFYDAYGDKEWARLDSTALGLIQFHVHERAIRESVAPGYLVLEVGPGPGRFTMLLNKLGARVTAADISPGQLNLHRQYAAAHEFEECVVGRHVADICDLSQFADESFDVVLALGGPLSYVFDQAPKAVTECYRVLRPGGRFLASVMNLWGTVHHYLGSILEFPADVNKRVIETGNLTADEAEYSEHLCHMFTSEEVRNLFEAAGFEILSMSASSAVTGGIGELLEEVRANSERWNALLEIELRACRSPGLVEAGTHLLCVGRKA